MTSLRPLLPLALLVAGSALATACSSENIGTFSSPYRGYGGSSGGAKTGGTTTPSQGNGDQGTGSSGGSTATSGNTSSGGTGSSSGGNASSSGVVSSSSNGSSGSSSSSSSGSSSGSVTPPATTPAFAVAVDNASPSINLADTTVLTVTITPQSWSGPVALTTTGLPTDITGAFDNAMVNVNGTTPVTAKLTLTSISSTAPNATPFQIVGTAGSVTQNASSTINVKSYITINIPVNADSMTESFGTVNITAPADIQDNPVTINFVNLDSTPHEIHAEGNAGFNHGLGTFGQGQADSPVRQVNQSGSYDWHLHDDAPPPGPPGGTVVIQ